MPRTRRRQPCCHIRCDRSKRAMQPAVPAATVAASSSGSKSRTGSFLLAAWAAAGAMMSFMVLEEKKTCS